MLKHVLMLLFVISSVLAGEYDSKCPAGMVQTYVDHRNTNVFSGATSVPISIVAFQHGGGAVWLKRKIKIEPRFEIHLKVSINEVINKNSKFSGFAISLSGTTHNYVRGILYIININRRIFKRRICWLEKRSSSKRRLL